VRAHSRRKLGSADGRWTASVSVSDRCLPSIVDGERIGAGAEPRSDAADVRDESRKVRIDWQQA